MFAVTAIQKFQHEKYYRLIALYLTLISNISFAGELNNKAFSTFGLGVENISFSETTKFVGTDLKQTATTTSPIQRTSGYTPIGENAGFHLTTSCP